MQAPQNRLANFLTNSLQQDSNLYWRPSKYCKNENTCCQLCQKKFISAIQLQAIEILLLIKMYLPTPGRHCRRWLGPKYCALPHHVGGYPVGAHHCPRSNQRSDARAPARSVIHTCDSETVNRMHSFRSASCHATMTIYLAYSFELSV